MTSSLAAYTDGIVNAKGATTPLDLPELQALTGILTALPPSPLPPGNALYERLQATMTGGLPTGSAEAESAAVRLCLCLAMDSANRAAVLNVVESSQSSLERIMTSLTLASTPASTTPVCPLQADMLLLMALCTNFELECRQALELFDHDVGTVIRVVAAAVATAAGVCPGVIPPFKGSTQVQAVANLVSIMRELTSWKMYDFTAFRRHDDASGGQSGPGNDVDMHRLASPFKGYIGGLCSQLSQTNLFHSLSCYYPLTLCRQSAEDQAELAWEVLVLMENLLTFTNVFAVQLRKHLLASGVLNAFLAPYLCQLLSTLSESGASPADSNEGRLGDEVAMVTLCARVLATLTFSIGGCQAFWRADGVLPVAVEAARRALLSPSTAGGTTATPRIHALTSRDRVELLSQVVRLAVNGHMVKVVPTVRSLWAGALVEEKERAALAQQLSDPTRRRQPLDVRSPVYESLREIFALTGSRAAAAVCDDVNYDTEDDWEVREASRSQLGGRGRRGRGRSHGHGGRGGGRSRQEEHHIRGKRHPRDGQRQRRRQRYAFLRSIRDRPESEGGSLVTPTAEEIESQRLTQLSSDDDETTQSPPADESSGVDLSRWRKGPPPTGIPLRYICALSHRLIRSKPTLSPHGYVFDQEIILDYLQSHAVCPISGEPLYPKDLIIDTALAEELDRVRFNFINTI